MFTGPLGPVEVCFYWPEAVFENSYWPEASGLPFSVEPCTRPAGAISVLISVIEFQLKLDDWEDSADRQILEMGGVKTQHAERWYTNTQALVLSIKSWKWDRCSLEMVGVRARLVERWYTDTSDDCQFLKMGGVRAKLVKSWNTELVQTANPWKW